MAKTNVKTKTEALRTHEGAPARRTDAMSQLRRSVLSCFLWEDEFYEDGKTIHDRIVKLAESVPPTQLARLAIEARKVHNLRHVSLLLLTVLCRTGAGTSLVSDTIFETIQRADEPAELVALYWKNGKKPLSAQLKKGLARALKKFNAYQLAKYNRDGAVKTRDVLFLTCPKPEGRDQTKLFKQLAENKLPTPDTWEVELSAGADKKETFTRLIKEGNLGYFALLRNLRNMVQAGVDPKLVRKAILDRKNGAEKLLPFRFIAAARHAPQYEAELDTAMMANLDAMPKLPGETIVLVDVSGSMDAKLSGKSDMMRIDAAATLASIVNGKCRVFTFSTSFVEVPARKGMAGVEKIIGSQAHGGTDLGGAVEMANKLPHDRLIVITDEQSQSAVPNPKAKLAYMINTASNRNGIGYGGNWTHIDGFSENVLKFIHEFESFGDVDDSDDMPISMVTVKVAAKKTKKATTKKVVAKKAAKKKASRR